MKGKGFVAVACLVAGIPVAAYGLTHGQWLLILVGLALVLVFIYLAYEWISGASKPMGAETTIKPAADAAWSMKDEPVKKNDDPGSGPRA
jgi:uncharacterized protein (DUF58 family)